jgi:hypothetical protein
MRFETSEMRNVAGERLSAAQQIAIAALHSADTVLHETNDLRAVGRRQPVASALQSHVGIKQGGGEIAVGRVLLVTVKCPQHQNHAAALLSGQGRDGWLGCSTREVLPQAKDTFQPLRQVLVERDDGSNRSDW